MALIARALFSDSLSSSAAIQITGRPAVFWRNSVWEFAVDSFANDFANKLRKKRLGGIEDKYYNPRHNPAGGELEGIEDKYYNPRHNPAGGELEGFGVSDDEEDVYYVPHHESPSKPKLSFHWDSTIDGFGIEENKTKGRDYILLIAAIVLLFVFSKS